MTASPKELTGTRDRLDGHQTPVPYSVLLKRPDLRHQASNIRLIQPCSPGFV